jgi:putative Holliday junction resolvase
MGRLIGIDVGTKRFGVAVSDPLKMFASPHEVIKATGDKHALQEVVRICAEQEAEKLVVGLPLNMDGSRGPAAERVETLVEKLKTLVDVPVVLWDERLTTKTAEAALIEADTRRERRKDLVDKIAAQVLLQHYIDAHHVGSDWPPEQGF